MKQSFIYLHMRTRMIERKRLVAFWMCMFSLAYVNAQNVTIDGLNYHLFADTHEAVINVGNTWSGELDIPSEISYNEQNFAVTGITSLAFYQCSKLTKVRIPKTIVQIINYSYSDYGMSGAVSPDYKNPFDGCTALESIEVDADNPIMKSVEGVLFSKDGTELYSYPGGMQEEEYTIPETVTWVGADVFSSNSYLSTLTIPNSVTYISSGICRNCVHLKMVKLSENITHIPAYSFDKCESLTFLDIPESVQGFGESVFRWTHFEKIVIRGTFPNGLRNDTFAIMDDATILYVQQSEINKFKKVFPGTVLPLEEYTSDINQMKIHQPSAIVYDLQGRRLTGEPGKGIYIQNGRKIIAK